MVENVSTRNISQCFGCDRCNETVQNGLCNQCYDGMEHGMWVTVTSATHLPLDTPPMGVSQ